MWEVVEVTEAEYLPYVQPAVGLCWLLQACSCTGVQTCTVYRVSRHTLPLLPTPLARQSLLVFHEASYPALPLPPYSVIATASIANCWEYTPFFVLWFCTSALYRLYSSVLTENIVFPSHGLLQLPSLWRLNPLPTLRDFPTRISINKWEASQTYRNWSIYIQVRMCIANFACIRNTILVFFPWST